jgi:hypothetical protein
VSGCIWDLDNRATALASGGTAAHQLATRSYPSRSLRHSIAEMPAIAPRPRPLPTDFLRDN